MPVAEGVVIAEQDVEGVRMPGDAAFIASGQSYRVDAPAGMQVVSVTHPRAGWASAGGPK